MGYQSERNWYIVDKSDTIELETLAVGDIRSFVKKDYRDYPVDIVLFLLNRDWKVLGLGIVTEFTPGNGITKVTYEAVKLFNEQEREFLTKLLKEMKALNRTKN